MLGKLMKHEWKGTWRVGGLMLCILAGMTLLGWLAIYSITQAGKIDDVSSATASMLALVGVFVLFAYSIAMASVSIGIYVYEGVRFYKTMYSAEGYLTHTLPVKKSQLLISKIIIGGIWILIIGAAMFISICVLITLGVPDANIWKVIQEFFKGYATFAASFKAALGINLTAYLIVLGIFILLAPFIGLMILFGSISIGQLFSGARVVMALVTYFGTALLTGILRSALSVVWNLGAAKNLAAADAMTAMGNTFSAIFYGQFLMTMGLQLAIALLMYFASWKITSSKLNLQ